jgi:hypothetical protein
VIRALAIFGASTVALAVAHAQTPVAADTQAPGVAAPASISTQIPKADLREASSQIRRAWSSRTLCWDTVRCAAYFSSFATALTFADGTLVPLAHEQRLSLSGRECIQHARAALHEGNRAMAVQWVMAAHLDNPLVRNWLADHPDALLEGLRHFGD